MDKHKCCAPTWFIVRNEAWETKRKTKMLSKDKKLLFAKSSFYWTWNSTFNIAYALGFVIATCRLLSCSVCNFKFYWHFCAKLCEISVTFTLINIVCTSYFEILGENLGSILWYYIIEALDGLIFLEYIFQT